MLLSLFRLEIKSLLRSSQLKTEVFSFVLKFILVTYLALILLGLGFATVKLVKEYFENQDVIFVISSLFIFYWLYDLMFRFMFGSSPIVNIKPLLILNIKQSDIVKYTLFKGYFKLFNGIHLFYFVPLSLLLIAEGYNVLSVIIWALSLLLLLSCNSFLSIFLDKVSSFFFVFIGIFTLLAFAQLNGLINIIPITGPVFYFLYQFNSSILLVILILVFWFYVAFKFYQHQLYLDKGLRKNDEQVKSLDLKYLSKLGTIGAFIKNDLYLIIRNKRPKTTIFMSFLFIFYPFLLVRFGEDPSYTMVFAAIFASGGFMMSFGQFVPSWDSTYYPLFMTQNVSYREYLLSKWYIIAFANIITLILCSFYIFISPVFFLAIVSATIFNIGFNSNIVLVMGAYINQSIDLTSNAGAFGNTKSFNINTLLLSLVILFVPLLIYILFQQIFNIYVGYLAVASFGIIGFMFRNKTFDIILTIYKKNKYKMLSDFKK